ncbi:uncharacterized protein LAESUDRAFT_638210, partial [Laetiporus sulphureus 93-53]
FLYEQLSPSNALPGTSMPLGQLPKIKDAIYVYYSAVAIFYAPDDPSGIDSMHRERIRAIPQWCGSAP